MKFTYEAIINNRHLWVSECVSVWVCECVSVLEKLREESSGEEGMKYSGVWIRNVLVCECVSVWMCECVSVWVCECVRGVERRD